MWRSANASVHGDQRNFFLKNQKGSEGRLMVRDRFEMATVVQRSV